MGRILPGYLQGGSLLGGGTSNKGLGSKCLTGMGLSMTGCLMTCGRLVSFTNCLWGDPFCTTGFWSGRLTSLWSIISQPGNWGSLFGALT